jgi:hypothetical protein
VRDTLGVLSRNFEAIGNGSITGTDPPTVATDAKDPPIFNRDPPTAEALGVSSRTVEPY